MEEEICRARKRLASDVQSAAKQGRYVIATVSVEKNVEEQILVPEDCLPGGPKENEFIAQCANCGQELVAFQSVFIHFAGLEKTRKQKPGKKSKVRIIQQYDCSIGSFVEKPNPWRAMAKEGKEKEGRSDHSAKSSSATQKANAQISRILNQHASAVQQQKQSQQQQQKQHLNILPAMVAADQQQQQSSWVQVQAVSTGQPLWAADLGQWGSDGQQASWLWATTPQQWVVNADDAQQWLTLSPEQIGWTVGPDGVLQAPQFITCVSGTTDSGLVPTTTTLANGIVEQLQDQKPAQPVAVASQLEGVAVSASADSTLQQQQAPVVAVQLWNGQQLNGLIQSQQGGTFVLANNLAQTLLGSATAPVQALDNSGTFVNVSNGVVNIMPLDGDIDFLDRSDLAAQIGSNIAASGVSGTATAASTSSALSSAAAVKVGEDASYLIASGLSSVPTASATIASGVNMVQSVASVQPVAVSQPPAALQPTPDVSSTSDADVSNVITSTSTIISGQQEQQQKASSPEPTAACTPLPSHPPDVASNVESELKMTDAGQEVEAPTDTWNGEADTGEEASHSQLDMSGESAEGDEGAGEADGVAEWDDQLLELQQAAEQFEQRYSDGSPRSGHHHPLTSHASASHPTPSSSSSTTSSSRLPQQDKEHDACSKLFDQVVFGSRPKANSVHSHTSEICRPSSQTLNATVPLDTGSL